MRYFLKLAYNGKNYFGWQRQPKQTSVQEVLEEKLSIFLRSEIAVVGAGRTDTGVHAKAYFAHFDADEIPDKEEFIFRMNSFLPKDIAIYELFPVKDQAHARFDATNRTYHYHFNFRKDPFLNELALQIHKLPNIQRMKEAGEMLIGRQDFTSFSRSGSDVKTFICDIQKVEWTQSQNYFRFSITADRFLRNMVRAIVGTLLEIGYEKMEVSDMKMIISRKDRSLAGPSAPAHGLYLARVEYPDHIFLNKPPKEKDCEEAQAIFI